MNPAILVNAAEVERTHPQLCDRPTFKQLQKITPGMVVKINAGQRDFWARIVAIDGELITGVVAMEIKFNRDHIFSIFKKEDAK